MKENLHNTISNRIQVILMIVVVMIFSACESKDVFIPDEIMGDVEEFYTDVQGAFSSQMFDVGEDFVFITANNTSVHIPSGSFMYADGTEVTGMVKVTLEDVLNKGEMIVHNLPTTSDAMLLASKGSVFVSFTQNGEELQIKEGKMVILRITDFNATLEAKLYDGFGENDIKDWSVSDQSMAIEDWNFFWDGKDWIGEGYEFTVSNSGWYSIAEDVNDSSMETRQVCATLPVELYDGNNSDVFLVLEDFSTVVPMEMDMEKMLFCTDYDNIPVDFDAVIISISSLGEMKYYFGMSNAIINMDVDEIAVFPASKTKEEILDVLGMF